MVEGPTVVSVVFEEPGEKIEKVYCAVDRIPGEKGCSALGKRESQG